MKILMNNDMKAVRRGEFVQANEDAGEFIFCEDCDFAVATLHEIAKVNKVKLPSKAKKAEIIETLVKHFGEIKMSEQNEPTMSDKVLEIVKEGIEAGKSDNDILVDIVMAGAKFTAAKRLFKQAVEASGLRISQKDRQEQANGILEGLEFKPESWDDVAVAIEKITEGVQDTNEKQALAVIKRWAKDSDVEMPKKKAGKKGPKGTFRDRVFGYIMDNPTVSEEDLLAWVAEEKADAKNLETIQKNASAFLTFARNYAEKVYGDDAAAA